MSHFNEQDEKELNIPLDLLRNWEAAMNDVWKFLLAYKLKEKAVFISQKDNKIFFQLGKGRKTTIQIFMVNNKYLQLSIKVNGLKDFEATISNFEKFYHEQKIRLVAQILTSIQEI
jgi:hypothetical protein